MEFLTNPIYNNAAYVDLEVEIRNAGEDDQEEAAIRISCPELGLDMTRTDIEIDNGDEETRRFQIDLPNDMDAGSYAVNVYAYYDDNSMTDSQIVTLEVLDYANPYGEAEEEAEDSSNTNSNIANPTYGTSSKVVGDSWYMVILLLLVLVVLGGIAFLASEYLFDNKKAKPIKEQKAPAKAPKKTTKKSAIKAPKKAVKKGTKAKAKAKKSYK